jgi:release factor glutamine methyltransferase
VTALRAALAEAAERLSAAGVPSPRHDAEVLAAHLLGVERGRLPALQDLSPGAAADFSALVERRAGREPLQHITGWAAFRYVEVAVGPGVFVPRPETEVVAGWAVDRACDVAATGRRPLVVDLCAGSGAIALAVADEVPTAVVHAVEVSPDAVAWARRNLAGSGVALHEADVADALPDLDGTVDVVVANPPYVPPGSSIRDPEVRAHDPALALWGRGPDGLDVVRAVARTAARLLRPGGWLVVEHADVQGVAVPALLAAQGGWAEITDRTDLSGRDRFATARREPAS